MAKIEFLILSHLKSTDFFFLVFLILVEVSLSLQLFKQKNLEVIPKCALYLSLVTSALPMSFIDCISNILTPFFCDHFHFYLYGPINYNFHLTYFIRLLLVSFFLLLSCGWSTVLLFFDLLFSSVPQ